MRVILSYALALLGVGATFVDLNELHPRKYTPQQIAKYFPLYHSSLSVPEVEVIHALMLLQNPSIIQSCKDYVENYFKVLFGPQSSSSEMSTFSDVAECGNNKDLIATLSNIQKNILNLSDDGRQTLYTKCLAHVNRCELVGGKITNKAYTLAMAKFLEGIVTPTPAVGEVKNFFLQQINDFKGFNFAKKGEKNEILDQTAQLATSGVGSADDANNVARSGSQVEAGTSTPTKKMPLPEADVNSQVRTAPSIDTAAPGSSGDQSPLSESFQAPHSSSGNLSGVSASAVDFSELQPRQYTTDQVTEHLKAMKIDEPKKQVIHALMLLQNPSIIPACKENVENYFKVLFGPQSSFSEMSDVAECHKDLQAMLLKIQNNISRLSDDERQTLYTKCLAHVNDCELVGGNIKNKAYTSAEATFLGGIVKLDTPAVGEVKKKSDLPFLQQVKSFTFAKKGEKKGAEIMGQTPQLATSGAGSSGNANKDQPPSSDPIQAPPSQPDVGATTVDPNQLQERLYTTEQVRGEHARAENKKQAATGGGIAEPATSSTGTLHDASGAFPEPKKDDEAVGGSANAAAPDSSGDQPPSSDPIQAPPSQSGVSATTVDLNQLQERQYTTDQVTEHLKAVKNDEPMEQVIHALMLLQNSGIEKGCKTSVENYFNRNFGFDVRVLARPVWRADPATALNFQVAQAFNSLSGDCPQRQNVVAAIQKIPYVLDLPVDDRKKLYTDALLYVNALHLPTRSLDAESAKRFSERKQELEALMKSQAVKRVSQQTEITEAAENEDLKAENEGIPSGSEHRFVSDLSSEFRCSIPEVQASVDVRVKAAVDVLRLKQRLMTQDMMTYLGNLFGFVDGANEALQLFSQDKDFNDALITLISENAEFNNALNILRSTLENSTSMERQAVYTQAINLCRAGSSTESGASNKGAVENVPKAESEVAGPSTESDPSANREKEALQPVANFDDKNSAFGQAVDNLVDDEEQKKNAASSAAAAVDKVFDDGTSVDSTSASVPSAAHTSSTSHERQSISGDFSQTEQKTGELNNASRSASTVEFLQLKARQYTTEQVAEHVNAIKDLPTALAEMIHALMLLQTLENDEKCIKFFDGYFKRIFRSDGTTVPVTYNQFSAREACKSHHEKLATSIVQMSRMSLDETIPGERKELYTTALKYVNGRHLPVSSSARSGQHQGPRKVAQMVKNLNKQSVQTHQVPEDYMEAGYMFDEFEKLADENYAANAQSRKDEPEQVHEAIKSVDILQEVPPTTLAIPKFSQNQAEAANKEENGRTLTKKLEVVEQDPVEENSTPIVAPSTSQKKSKMSSGKLAALIVTVVLVVGGASSFLYLNQRTVV